MMPEEDETEELAAAIYCRMRFQRCDDRHDDEADADRCLQRAEAFVAAREDRRKRLKHMASLSGTKETKGVSPVSPFHDSAASQWARRDNLLWVRVVDYGPNMSGTFTQDEAFALASWIKTSGDAYA